MASITHISPLAPKTFPDLPEIAGVRFASAAAGVRYSGRTDVMLVLFDEPATVAGVFTKSLCPSAPVDWCREQLPHGKARALVVNSGNANAFTGQTGVATVTAVAEAVAKATGASTNEIYMASTGVIGEPLEASRITAAIDTLKANAHAGALMDAARAIMTTDTFPKVVTERLQLDGVDVTINGMAKGAGMIAPDMATMLSFVFTDAPLSAELLQTALSREVQPTFNSITVDSDTSTSDTLLLFSTGGAAKRGSATVVSEDDPRFEAFCAGLRKALLSLAQQVARDGEGARKLIEVRVDGAAGSLAAKRIALSIANSPLVKTACAGEDANWGRVVMAVGKAGELAERDRLDIWFGDIRVAHQGLRDPDYSEAAASAYMKNPEIVIRAAINLGEGSATVWTCDLTKEYVAINGDYRS
jgi:glutamate N-acetyltransferase/amino-acid N-acetyltransferase